MNKEMIYTRLIFVLSIIIITAGWFFTKGMLRRNEENVLAREGELYVGSSNSDILDGGHNSVFGESYKENAYVDYPLSEEEMGKILAAWDLGGKEIPLEPIPGQLNMEEAIEAGENWIIAMAEKEIVPSELMESAYDSVSAKLLSLESRTGIDETMLSYWSVQYTKGDTVILLTIHAVSGEIWRADISIKGGNAGLYEYTDDELLRIAFPFMGEIRNEELRINNVIYQVFGEGYVYASVKRSDIVVDGEEPVTRLNLRLSSNIAIEYN